LLLLSEDEDRAAVARRTHHRSWRLTHGQDKVALADDCGRPGGWSGDAGPRADGGGAEDQGEDPGCAALANLLKEKGPATEKAWDQATQHAAILNEMSYVVMDDGRCPDKAWADAAKTLRECSGKALAAVKEKKTEDAQAAFKALTGACQACHKVHRHDE
jgi:hypothetical protein